LFADVGYHRVLRLMIDPSKTLVEDC
jgi:hypothetical protein